MTFSKRVMLGIALSFGLCAPSFASMNLAVEAVARKDYKSAIVQYSLEALRGNEEASYQLGLLMKHGLGQQAHPARALYWFRKAADEGHANAAFEAAQLLESGLAGQKDSEQARKYYDLAAAQGVTTVAVDFTQSASGSLNAGATPTTLSTKEKREEATRLLKEDKPDYRRVLQLYIAAAEEGDRKAQHMAGYMIARGLGAAKDPQQALSWYERAAGAGFLKSQYVVGRMYQDGIGIERNQEQGIYWLSKAARDGYADAQYHFAVALERGQGIERDGAEAFEWYQLAAGKGQADAQYRLAVLYYAGKARNPERAMAWFRKAAGQNHAGALRMLGLIHLEGKLISRDKQEALKHYEQAALAGSHIAPLDLALIHCRGQKGEAETTLLWVKAAKPAYLKPKHQKCLDWAEGQLSSDRQEILVQEARKIRADADRARLKATRDKAL